MDEFEIKFVKFLNKFDLKKIDNFLSVTNSVRFLAFFWMILTIFAIIKHPEIAGKIGLAVVVVSVLHFSITEGLIKHLLTRFFPKRRRPYITYSDSIKPIGKKFSDASFPSSHMATTVAMLVVLVSFYPSLFWLAGLMIVGMAFSRLHNGMHYPSDVLVGSLLGFGYGWVALEVVKMML